MIELTDNELAAALIGILYYEELRQAPAKNDQKYISLNPYQIEQALSRCAKTSVSKRKEELRPMFEPLLSALGGFEP